MSERLVTSQAKEVTDIASISKVEQLIESTRHNTSIITPEIIEAIEDLDEFGGSSESSFDAMNDSLTLIGVLSGVKPAGLIYHDAFNDDGYCDELQYRASRLGLSTVEYVTPEGLLYISMSKHIELSLALLDEVKSAHDTSDDIHEYKIGALLGYPKTATQYYLKRLKAVDELDRYPRSVIHESNEAYVQFVLSPENYQQELESYSQPLEEAVKTLTPKIYDRLDVHFTKR